MNDTSFDRGASDLQKRMAGARNRPQQQTQPHKSAVSLHLQEDFEDDIVMPLPSDMRNHINSRRSQAEAEEEKMRRLGVTEYNRQTYGDKKYTPQFAYNDDGDPNMDVIKMMNQKWGDGNQVSYNTPLPGHLETDSSFLDNGAVETSFDNGVASSLGYQQPKVSKANPMKPPQPPNPLNRTAAKELVLQSANKAASKELTLRYNKPLEIPLSKSQLSKIRIVVEYTEDCAEEDKTSVITLVKKSRGGNEKTSKIEITGEGKVLSGESFMYFFEKREDNFTELHAKLTGARVVEASLILN
jgi:hypothetical protein